MSVVSDLRGSRELLLNLTAREIRGKYKRTALGQIWSLINPIAQLAIYSVVFGFVFKGNRPEPGSPSGLDIFALWLSAGLLPWLYFSNVVTGGMGALLSNANLIKKVYFPRETLVASAAFSFTFSFLIELSVLTVAMFVFGGDPLIYLPAVVGVTVLLTALALGLAFALSVSNVYFRDTQHFISILMAIWLYATPIIYPISLIDAKKAEYPWLPVLWRANPMERFVQVYRNLLYDNRWPSLDDTVYIVVVPTLVLAIGYSIFKRYEGRLAEEL